MANTAIRKATNVSLDPELVIQAKELSVNVSRACEAGLAKEIKRVREERWLVENRAAIEAYNEWIDKNGLPLADLRMF